MAEIICMECKNSVSDTSGHCPECGYPFDIAIAATNGNERHSQEPEPQIARDRIEVSLDSLKNDIEALQRATNDIRQLSDTSAQTAANTTSALAEITRRLDALASVIASKESGAPADSHKKTLKELLTAFYKTLNSPNSMFEYMFYMCIVQLLFVIVNLFLATYIVTLVRG